MFEFSVLAAFKFRTLDASARDRIAARLRSLSSDAGRHLTRLRSVEGYRLPLGDERVILDVDWEKEVPFVLTLGNRGTAYR